ADLHVVRDEQRLESRIDEGRERGGEVDHRAGLHAGRRVGFAGVRDRATEASRHALAAAVDLVDVPSDDLLLEECVRHLYGTRAGEKNAGEEDVREDDEDEEEPDPSRRPWRRRRGRSLASLGWILTPRGRARFLSHGAVGRHPFQSTRRGTGPPRPAEFTRKTRYQPP